MKKLFKFPIVNIVIILAITVFFGYWMPGLTVDNDLTSMIPDDHPANIAFEEIQDDFGGSQLIIMGVKVKSGSVLDPKVLSIIGEITEKVSDVEYVDEVRSITNTDLIEGIDGGMEVISLEDLLPESEDEIPAFKEKLLSWDLYKQQLYSKDFKAGSITVILESERFESMPIAIGNGEQMKFKDRLTNKPVLKPDDGETTFEVSYVIDGTTYTASADKAGVITGEHIIKGRLNYKEASWQISFAKAPDKESKIDGEYTIETNNSHFHDTYKGINKILDEYRTDDIEFFISGMPVLTALTDEYMMNDLKFLVPFVILVVILTLFFSFKRIGGVVLPLITVIISTIWLMGLMSVMGKSISMLGTIIPVILIAIGSAYGIHIITHYYEDIMRKGHEHINDKDHKLIIFHVLSVVGKPVLLAALTTAVGFLSFATSKITPIRNFGLFTSFGVMSALIVSIILIPSLLMVRHKSLKKSSEKMTGEDSPMTRVLMWIYHYFVKRKYRVIIFSILIVATAIYGILQINIDTQVVKFFKPDSVVVKADRFLNEEFAGTNTLDIKISCDDDGGLADPLILKEMDNLADYLEDKYDEINKIIGFHDMIKRMNQVMHYPDEFEEETALTKTEFLKLINETLARSQNVELTANDLITTINKAHNYKGEQFNEIPFNPAKYGHENMDGLRQLITQYLLLYSGDLDSFAGDDIMQPNKARMTIVMTTTEAAFIKDLVADIEDYADQNFPEGYNVIVAGSAQLQRAVNNLVVSSQVWSLLIALIVVFLIITIAYRSLVAGIIGIIPLTISILINFGLMGLARIDLSVATSIFASIAIGTGVDYTIHFMSSYKHHWKKYRDPEIVTQNALITSGKAIIFNALSVGLGFVVLMFSNFIAILYIGLLIAVVMATSSIASLTILPVLINLIKPKFLDK